MIRKTVAAILLAGMTLSACGSTATECYLHIKVRVGTADKWPYSVEQLANAIDSGFETET